MVGYFRDVEAMPSVCYYLPLAQWRYLMRHDYFKDTSEDLIFVRHDIVINTVELDEIVPHLERVAADPHQSEVMELMIHEQYFCKEEWPQHYLPDAADRAETAIRWAAENGYEPVFFEEGFLGATTG